jgi:hypothetical protein
MSYLLYRFSRNPRENSLQYVREVKNGKIVFTKHPSEARRFFFFKAVILAIRYRVSWIPEKYIGRSRKQ